MQIRHGDILFERVAKLPETPKSERQDGVIAEGEATGHAHRFHAASVELFGGEQPEFVNVLEKSDLTHQEHATVTFEPGVYRVIRQREYVSPTEERRVLD